jgi:hypothetical protein
LTSPRRVGPLLWIRLLSSLAPGEQLGVGGVDLYHLTQRQIAPLRQGGEDGARGRVGQGAVVELLLAGGLEQTEALEGAETSLDAGSSLVAGGVSAAEAGAAARVAARATATTPARVPATSFFMPGPVGRGRLSFSSALRPCSTLGCTRAQFGHSRGPTTGKGPRPSAALRQAGGARSGREAAWRSSNPPGWSGAGFRPDGPPGGGQAVQRRRCDARVSSRTGPCRALKPRRGGA